MKPMFMSIAAIAFALSGAANAKADPADRAYLQKAVQGADYELALAQTAAASAKHAEVRAYANRIVKDHDQANMVLKQLLRTEGVPVPAGMTASDNAKLSKLKTLRGVPFDKRYVDEVTRINAEDERESSAESRTTKNAQIKAYLKRFSQMDAEHKQMGEQLKKKVG